MSRVYIMPDGGQANADEYDATVVDENADKVYLSADYACYKGVPDGLLDLANSLEDEVNETNRELVEARAWARTWKAKAKVQRAEIDAKGVEIDSLNQTVWEWETRTGMSTDTMAQSLPLPKETKGAEMVRPCVWCGEPVVEHAPPQETDTAAVHRADRSICHSCVKHLAVIVLNQECEIEREAAREQKRAQMPDSATTS